MIVQRLVAIFSGVVEHISHIMQTSKPKTPVYKNPTSSDREEGKGSNNYTTQMPRIAEAMIWL